VVTTSTFTVRPTVPIRAAAKYRYWPGDERGTHRCHRPQLLLGRYAGPDLLSPGELSRSARKSSQVR
jgi:hypothetical protein